MKLQISVGSLVLWLLLFCSAEATVFVSGTAPAGGDGNSWATAYNSIQAGIDDATTAGEQVWVAEGVYEEPVRLTTGVLVYGGFAGTETSVAQRDPSTHQTVIDVSHVNQGQPYRHAVLIVRIRDAGIDGFTIRGGNADFPGPPGFIRKRGAGIYCIQVDASCFVSNCTVVGNSSPEQGGGIACVGGSPRFLRCTIRGNTADREGGGCYCEGSEPEFRDCTFEYNVAEEPGIGYGGGLFCRNSTPTLTGCLILANAAGGCGGGLAADRSRVRLSNTVICSNSGHQSGGGIDLAGSSVTLANCMLSGNVSIVLQGGALASRYWSGSRSALVLSNCIVSGNAACTTDYKPQPGGGAMALTDTETTITNCLFSGNSTGFTKYPGGGIVCYISSPAIINTVFENHNHLAILEWGDASDATLIHCLFHNNPDGDIYDFETTTQTGAVNINANVAGATGVLDGDPLFRTVRGGPWTAVDFNPATSRTLLTSSDWFIPDRLVGSLINPNAAQRRQAYIVSNSAQTVEVAGDVRSWVNVGDLYDLIDYRVRSGSPVIDTGTASHAPPVDMKGVARPLDTAGVGADGAGAGFDIGPYEYFIDLLSTRRFWLNCE